MKIFYSIIILTFFFACVNVDEHVSKNSNKESDSIYNAKLFRINETDDYVTLTIFSKTGELKDTYYLIDRTKKIPKELEAKNIIKTPVKNIVCLSTTHIAFVDILDEIDKITAVSGGYYVYNKELKNKINDGTVKDVGYENSLDFELLLKLKPDVVTVYDINGTISPIINKIKKFNIPVIQINEYLESSALSQAEWMKFFGELFNKRKPAYEKFNEIKLNYNKLLVMTDTIKEKPKVLLNMPWKGTWYMPGGYSNMARLINDAGGEYIWNDTGEKHNIPLNIEEVYIKASDVDVWLNPGQAKSLNEVIQTDSRLRDFKALKNQMIYNRVNRLSDTGGNDYMESGTVRPDLILKDLIKILHPSLLPDHKLYYYKRLK